MKTAIVYSSKGGATAMYAAIVADVLEAAGQETVVIDLGKVRKPDLSASLSKTRTNRSRSSGSAG